MERNLALEFRRGFLQEGESGQSLLHPISNTAATPDLAANETVLDPLPVYLGAAYAALFILRTTHYHISYLVCQLHCQSFLFALAVLKP